MRRILLILSVLLCSMMISSSYAQNFYIDALKKRIEHKQSHPRLVLAAYLHIMEEYSYYDSEEMHVVYDEMKAYMESLGNPVEHSDYLQVAGSMDMMYRDHTSNVVAKYKKNLVRFVQKRDAYGEALTRRLLGRVHEKKGAYAKAITQLEESKRVFKEVANDTLQAALSGHFLGLAYEITGHNDLAFANLLESKKVFEFYDCPILSAQNNNYLGYVNFAIGDLKQAEYCYKNTLSDLHKYEQHDHLTQYYMLHASQAYQQLGDIKLFDHKLDSAEWYFRRALLGFQAIKDIEGIHATSLEISYLMIEKGELNKAWSILNEATSFFEKKEEMDFVARAYNYKGGFFIKKEQWSMAKDWIKESLKISASIDDKPLTINNYQKLSFVFEQLEQYDSALMYYHSFHDLYQEVRSDSTNNAITHIQVQYETFRSEKEKMSLQKEVSMRRLNEEKNQKIIFVLVLLMIISLIAIFILWRFLYLRKKNYLMVQESNDSLSKLNEALLDSQEELSASNETKDQLFSIVAHDLKSPLNSLLGFTDLLSKYGEQMPKEEILQISESLDENVRSIYEFLEDLLLWARSQMDKIVLSPKLGSLEAVVQSNFKLLSQAAANKNIKLSSELNNEHKALFDENTVQTILRNLIANSIKFTNEGGEVKVSTKVSEDKKMLEVCVEDNGVGIPADVLDSIFKVGHKHSTLGTQQEKGTGLGLGISQEFVKKNGGEIWVTSEEGVGSKFYFTLPIK